MKAGLASRNADAGTYNVNDELGRSRGAVVITGSSTGIGAAAAAYLANHGFRVFAGMRGDRNGHATTDRLMRIVIDVTDERSIASAADAVRAEVGDSGLAGLVNNAGIVKPAPLEHQVLSDFREQLEVNLVGQVAVTQAFLPLIRQGQGRIVNVGSIGGRMALPLHGAYSASKFGMEAISDALRLELRQWGIPVSLVDPGATETAIFDKTIAEIDRVRDELEADGNNRYEELIAAVRTLVDKTSADAAPAHTLAEAIGDALMSDRPKTRYLAGHDAKATANLARALPDRAKDRLVARTVRLPEPERISKQRDGD